MSALLAAIVGVIAWRLDPQAVLSTRIFAALGWERPDRVDLPRLTARHVRASPRTCMQFHPFSPWVFRY